MRRRKYKNNKISSPLEIAIVYGFCNEELGIKIPNQFYFCIDWCIKKTFSNVVIDAFKIADINIVSNSEDKTKYAIGIIKNKIKNGINKKKKKKEIMKNILGDMYNEKYLR